MAEEAEAKLAEEVLAAEGLRQEKEGLEKEAAEVGSLISGRVVLSKAAVRVNYTVVLVQLNTPECALEWCCVSFCELALPLINLLLVMCSDQASAGGGC